MSFTRVKPGGWAVNEKLRSAEQNQLDIDHENSVDKTGDTITGIVAVGSGARINFASGAKCTILSGGIYEAQAGSNTNFLDGSFVTINATAALSCLGTFAMFGGAFTASSGSTFELDCQLTANGNAEFNDTSEFNGTVEFNENVTLTSAALFVATGSVIGVQGGAGISWANTANATFQSGATATFQGGSFLVHSSTSTDTYASGSLLEQVSGSVWDLKGSTTFTPTSIVYFSFGNSVGFASAPTFFNGFNATTAGTAAFAVPATFSSTVAMSGATTISGAATLSGATTTISSATTTLSGTNNRLKLTARDRVKKIPLCAGVAEVIYSDGGGGYITTQSPTYLASSDTLLFQVIITDPTPHRYSVPLYPPDGSTVKNVTVVFTGSAKLTVTARRNGSSIQTGFATSPGTISLTINESVTTATESFCVELVAEIQGGVNSDASVTSMTATYGISEYDEG